MSLRFTLLLPLIACGSCSRERATGVTSEHLVAFDAAAFAVDPRATPSQEDVIARERIAPREPPLHIGVTAPALQVDGWLRGEPVTLRTGTIYVVETWATWCKPCLDAMPDLSDLAERYAQHGVVVLAINVEEAEVEEIRAFVAARADVMHYAVAYDRRGVAAQQWIEAAGLAGLPASFVVGRDGRIAWVGHPEALDDVVDAIAHDRWNLEEARARATRARLADPYAKRVVELLETDPARGYELARAALVTVLHDQPEHLDGLAYHIFAGPNVAERDLDVAYAAGALASASTGWSDPASLETLSKIREAQHRFREAIALQRRAVDVSGGESRHVQRLQRLVTGSE